MMSDIKEVDNELRAIARNSIKRSLRIAALITENKRLAEFARAVITDWYWGSDSMDGCDMQDFAESFGLIRKHIATADDVGEESDYEVGDMIYKFTAALAAATGYDKKKPFLECLVDTKEYYRAGIEVEKEENAYLSEQVRVLTEGLEISLSEMVIWRESDICDCDGNGHICGLPRLQESIAIATKALAASPEPSNGVKCNKCDKELPPLEDHETRCLTGYICRACIGLPPTPREESGK